MAYKDTPLCASIDNLIAAQTVIAEEIVKLHTSGQDEAALHLSAAVLDLIKALDVLEKLADTVARRD